MSRLPEINSPGTYVCFFDGSCYPNNPGGRMGQGIVIKKDGLIMRYSGGQPPAKSNTNNVSEYLALKALLSKFVGRKGCKIRVYGDSNLAISQMTGEFRIKNGSYVKYAYECLHLAEDIRRDNDLKFYWIPREKNREADELSKSYIPS